MVDHFTSLFNCLTVSRSSDKMPAPSTTGFIRLMSDYPCQWSELSMSLVGSILVLFVGFCCGFRLPLTSLVEIIYVSL